MKRAEHFEQRVIDVLKRLQPGEVVSYGEVADEAGFPRAARAVGNLLAYGPDGLPWWRVIRADGSLAARNRDEQVRRLESEGVQVTDERVISRPDATKGRQDFLARLRETRGGSSGCLG